MIIVKVTGVVVATFFIYMNRQDGSFVQFCRRVKYISDLHHPTNIGYTLFTFISLTSYIKA